MSASRLTTSIERPTTAADQAITAKTSLQLPLFVPCLFMGIVLSNTVPLLFPRIAWPARTASLELISSYALSVFLAMSLMSMQLWTLAGVAGQLLIVVSVADGGRCRLHSAGGISDSRGRLPGSRPVRRLYRPFPWINADSYRLHDGDYEELWPGAERLRDLPLVSAFFVAVVNVAVITLFLKL